ncbi:interactor of constitutive active ROPs 3 isoform X1 [Vigna umbellata]|uniref:interactor of constitutive active ROPs 3 isoform X1 n=1 Tax=Vigna umbellata TaxID=87088 RepID=UPI001F5EA44A|nr:interactor of constitutive active ROPs 3 isoform X1 [Vigna umbellata]
MSVRILFNMATRSGSSEVPQKVSPRAVRQLRPTTVETDSVSSSSQANKSSKERSPKVTDRRSPRSPVVERKRPSKISELESQISQLQNDLKKVMDQLVLSESSKRQAQQDALESKEQLLALSAKFEDSQKHVLDLCAAGEGRVLELQKIIDERDMACQSELEASKKQLSVESAALASAMNEIQMLKTELELVANCESVQSQQAKSADMELLNLKQNLSEALSLVDTMKNQLRDYKESEAQAQALVNETMLQHEAAKKSIEILRADVAKAVDAYNTIALELDQSKARVSSLEALVSKLQTDPISSKFEHQPEIWIEGEGSDDLEAEVVSLKSEVGRLQYAVETAETKYQEEKIQSTVQIRSAYELVEQIKSETGKREGELEAELKRQKADIEELKANLMDKETELQGIVEENDNLNTKLQESMSSKNEHELKRETKRLEECVAELKSDMMDKETTLQSISEENEMLKMEINKLSDGGKVSEEVAAEVEGAKAAEREALMKLGIVMEEADRSNKKAARVAEQLEAAQAANLEMEAELRRLKVQSDQWRKAAEAAAAMLSSGNNGKLTERTVSLDNNYKCSPYAEDMDDDFQRKKNGNMLKKFGVLWKKPQK